MATNDPPAGSSNTQLYDWANRLAAQLVGLATSPFTNAQLADMAESTIKGRAVGAGTGDPQDLTATQATAILNAFTDALKGLVPASGGGTANFLRADGTFAAPPSGAILQCLQNTYVTNANLTTAIPYDDTTPTSSEGTQVLSQAITPADNTNKVLCLVFLWGTGASGVTSAALFRGTTCINAAAVMSTSTGADVTDNAGAFVLALAFLDSPASASAQTYTVRVGPDTAAVMRLNGTTGARRFGGASACTLTLMEVAA